MSTEHALLKFTSKTDTPSMELCALEDGDRFDLNLYQMSADNNLSAIHKVGRKMTSQQLERLAVRILQVASYADPELNLKEKYNLDDSTLEGKALEL